jgi:hypothetical protein
VIDAKNPQESQNYLNLNAAGNIRKEERGKRNAVL